MDPVPAALIFGGVALVAFGLLSGRARLGRLPGDVSARRGGVSVYAPLGTSLMISVIVTIALNLALCGAFR